MKTFLAKLMFNVAVENGRENSEFDEQIRLIQSVNIEDALYKARLLGRKEEETFLGANQKPISWRFIDVADIYALEDLKDGQQLYSSSVQVNDADAYINYIRRKSMELQTRNLSFA